MKFISLLVILTMLCTSCSSLQPIQIAQNQPINRATLASFITKGDIVKIQTTNGKSHEFEVENISEVSISGEKIAIAFKDILTIEKSTFDIWKTSYVIASVIGILVLIGLSQMAPPPG